jgi:hypothetical protein
MIKRSIFLVSMLVLIGSSSMAQEKVCRPIPSTSIEGTILSTIHNFFEGKDTAAIITYISDGKFEESIPDSKYLSELYKNYRIEMFKAYFTRDEKVAIIQARTNANGNIRFHTFVFEKNENDKWEVKSWHSSRL